MMLGNDENSLMVDDGAMRDEDSDRAAAFNRQYEAAPTEPEQHSNKWALRDRLKSRVLWAAVIGCIMTVFSAFGVWERIGITAEGFREIVAAVGAVLAAFGVFNDPTNREGF